MTVNRILRPLGLVAALALSFASVPAVAHEHGAHAAAPVVSAAQAAVAEIPALAARYALQVGKQRTDWYLWRDKDTVETANTAVGQNNLWERLADGSYHYRRVFNQEQRVVEYVPGELRARNAEPDWRTLSSVVSPLLLEQLKRGASRTLFGQKATHYSGVAGGRPIDVWWLERDQIPASLRIGSGADAQRMRLVDVRAEAPDSWPRASEARIAAYALLDASDLGDMESDPFVARLLQAEGHSHAH